MPEDMLARLWTPGVMTGRTECTTATGVMHDRAAPAVQCEVRQHSPRSMSQPGAPICQLASCLPVLSSVVLCSEQISEVAASNKDEASQARLPRAPGRLMRADGGRRAQQGLCRHS